MKPMRSLGWTVVVLCIFSLALAGCSDDAASVDGEQTNNGGNNQQPDDGGSQADGDNDGPNNGQNNGPNNGSNNGQNNGTNNGSNNGTCSPTVIFLEYFQPNVYMLLDRSNSMDGEPMTQAQAGFDAVADALADRIRFGFGAYPYPSAGCSMSERVHMGAHSAADLKDGWATVTAAGGTPTGQALYEVRTKDVLRQDSDEYHDERPKALILITDGDPTICEDDHPSVDEARALADQGVPVFVVGFRSEANPDNLNALADAGGTDAPGSERFYVADDDTELIDAIDNISNSVIGCTNKIDPAPDSGDLLSVEIEGQAVPRDTTDGFSYDASTEELQIHGSWCDTLQSSSRDGLALKVTINCPDCTPSGDTCTDANECCSGVCDGGVCTELCVPDGKECLDSDDCCTGTCTGGASGGLTGVCAGG